MASTVVKITSVQSGINEWLTACASRVNLIDGYLNRVVKQDYINAQLNRFKSKNSGADFTGDGWKGLDPTYQTYKRKKYADYPEGGDTINIATSNLLQSLILSDEYYPSPRPRKIRRSKKGGKSAGQDAAGSLAVVDATSIHIYTLVPYAKYVDEKRTFTGWSQNFWNRINRGIMDYLTGRVDI